jgi:cobalt-zinc-cadmium efflux system outer membrane protein
MAGNSVAIGQSELAGPAVENLPPGTTASMSLEDFEQLALERNPTLVQAGAQVRISRGEALQAGLPLNPEVGYVSEQIGAEGTAGELQGMFIEQEIVTGGKLRLSRAKYAQRARQAEIQVLAQRYRVLYSVRVAYYEALAQQQLLALRKQTSQNSSEITTTVSELRNVGQANRTDVLQAEIAYQRAHANEQMAQRRLQSAWEQLAAVAGIPGLSFTSLEGRLDFAGEDSLDRDTALAHLLECSPQIRFARAEVVRDQIGLQRERVEPIPNVIVRADTGYNFESRDTVAGVEVGFRLPIFDKNQGTILQAQAELQRAQAEVARVELMLRREFAEAFAEYESARLLAETYQREALPRADEAYRLYMESFKQRRAAWPQVLDAQRDYLELYEEYWNRVLEARRAEAQIASFFLKDGLSQPQVPTPEGHRDATPKPR